MTAWAGPGLLVPITVEALVVTELSHAAAWSAAPPNYEQLAVFAPPLPQPFNTTEPSLPDGKPFTGVVVRWALPDAFTHGRRSGDGPHAYPPIPNRWLVARRARDASDPTRWAIAAWIVASDVAGRTGTSSYPDPSGKAATAIGRAWPIDKWRGEQATRALALETPLSAVGPGTPTFAAYAPGVLNVLSFIDRLDGIAMGPVSYVVLGWYGDPALDPLAGTDRFGPGGWQTEAEWAQVMTALGLSLGSDADVAQATKAVAAWAAGHGVTVGGSDRDLYPARSLCHGLVFDVGWPGHDGPLISGVPISNPQDPGYVAPQVAIGHRAFDGLAALVAGAHPDQAAELVRILEALQLDTLDLLDRADGAAQLGVRLQQGWFATAAAGTVWGVVAPPDPAAPAGSPAPPRLPAAQRALRGALNAAQRDLDIAGATLDALQRELYALWWKAEFLPMVVPPPTNIGALERAIADARRAAETEADATLGLLAVRRQQRDAAYGALLGALPEGCTLKPTARAPFLAPADPVLVVTGAHRAFRHGEDDRFSDDTTLLCRVTGQTLAGIEVPAPGGPVTVGAAAADLPTWPSPDRPAEVPDLMLEAFLLDVGNAPQIAAAAALTDPQPLDTIRAQQTLIWNPATGVPLDQQTIAEQSGLQSAYGFGALPSKVGVELWSPPWTPLYLDWQVSLFGAAATTDGTLTDWERPSTAGTDPLDELTYSWTGPVPPDQTGPVTVTGRSLLTPQATTVLAARIEDLLDHYGGEPDVERDLWALQDALEYVRNADVLTQSLGGFGDALLERALGNFRTPDDDSLDPWLAPSGGPPVTPDWIPEPKSDPSSWNPVLAGHLQLERLCVVDAFGQVYDVLGALQTSGQTYQPILATDLEAPHCPTLARLKPRVVQPARVELRLLAADDDTVEASAAAGRSPLCGWIVLNELDRSLLVYDDAGRPQGELLLAVGAARWLPSPDTAPPGPAERSVAIADRRLAGIVEGILTAPGGGVSALKALLALIDDVAWSTEPGGGWADQELPVLAGRPIAVVRAGLALELQGPPAWSQRWDDTGRRVTGGFEDVRWPVQLGATELLDDGLIGFYLDDDYAAINSAYTPAKPDPYVAAGRPELSLAGDAVLLTLLLAPGSCAHAISGILPPVSVRLPAAFASPPLGRMDLTFRAGPVLGDAAGVSMPLPALREGAWSWLRYGAAEAPAQAGPVLVADAVAQLDETPALVREGWLRLELRAGATRLAYTVAPTSVACGSVAAIVVSISNATHADVACRQIVLTVPVGTGAADLCADPSTIVVSAPGDWGIETAIAGDFTATLTPPGRQLANGATAELTVAGVRVNAAAGATALGVQEVTDETRPGSVPVVKIAPAGGQS